MSKLRKSAQGEECLIRLPGICNGNPETTVLAHLPDGTGGKMGGKSHDLCSVYACSACHDAIDGRAHVNDLDASARLLIKVYAAEGHYRTLNKFVEKGLVRA
jgi:hypothetical protein